MAADLFENFQYGLSSSGLSGADKTVLLLKLTDPSLKCIEQYQKLKYSTSRKPSIQFKGNSGVITFPSSEAKDGEREFAFTVQPLHAPPTSSFESIQHYCNSRGESKLASFGSIHTKVTVSGTDEVYKATQKKIKQADEDMKNVSTKEVKQNQFKPGHRVKRKSISAHAKKIISSSSSSSSTNNPSVSSNSSSYSSTLSGINASSMPTTLSTSSSVSSRNSLQTSTSSSKSAIPGSSSSSSSSRSSSSAKTSGASSKGSSSALQSQKSAVHNKSYRERVIHLLALKPYKKPELLLRLRGDGIPPKEKNQLAVILPQVATLTKENSYVLNKNLYNEVTSDWPAYTEADKHELKRKKAELFARETPSPPSQPSPHHVTSNSSSSTAATSSPSTRPSARPAPKAPSHSNSRTTETGSKGSSSTAQKRPLLPEVKDYKTKKPRIAHSNAPKPGPGQHTPPQLSPSRGPPAPNKKVPSPVGLFKKVPSPSSTTNAPPSTTTTISNSPSSHHTQQSALSSPSVSTTRNSPDCCDSTGNTGNSISTASTTSNSTSKLKESVASSGRSEKQAKSSSRTSESKEEKRPVGKESPSGDVSSTSVVPEYLMKYNSIRSLEQRQRYKEEFNNLYPKYRDHHKFIEGFKHKFKKLQEELNRTPKDSREYDKLQDKVIEEYSKTTQNPEYKAKYQRWKELHDLLGHIKSLIAVYDNDRLHVDNT